MHTNLSAAVNSRVAASFPSRYLSACVRQWHQAGRRLGEQLYPLTGHRNLNNILLSPSASFMVPTSGTSGTSQAYGLQEARRRVLDQSWSFAAQLYLQELAPRFSPWLCDAIRALLNAQPSLPPGFPVVVPCCGPGHELPVLHRCLRGQHPVSGNDLAQGMVQLAQSVIQMELTGQLQNRAQNSIHSTRSIDSEGSGGLGDVALQHGSLSHDSVQVAVSKVLSLVSSELQAELLEPLPAACATLQRPGSAHPSTQADQHRHSNHPSIQAQQMDACLLDQHYRGAAAAVVSVFGLQQLGPLAPQALASWVQCLAPGGVAIIVLWPSHVEPAGGPWAAYAQALEAELALDSASPQQSNATQPSDTNSTATSSSTQQPWEKTLTSLAAQVPGCSVVMDTLINHWMAWDDVDQFWQVMTQGGPWHARRMVSGDAFMDRLKQQWLQLVDLPAHQAQYNQLLSEADTTQAACIPFLQQRRQQQVQQAQAHKQAFAHCPCARMVVISRSNHDVHSAATAGAKL